MSTAGYRRKERLSRRSFQSLAMIAWKIAPIATASSTRVQTSQTRNSSVGSPQLGRTSHQIWDALGIDPVATSVPTTSSNSAHEPSDRGMPERGKERNTTLRYDLSPVRRPIQNGELVERQRT